VAVSGARCYRPLSLEERGATGASASAAPVRPPAVPAGGSRVLLLESGLRAAEADGVADALRRAHGCEVVRLTPWELSAGGPLDRPWQAATATRELAELRRAVAAGHAEPVDAPGAILASPHLGFQLDRIVAELAAAARIGESFAALIDDLAPALCVLGHDAFTIERLLVRIARRRGVPTAALIHGGFRPRRIYRDVTGEADRLLVWGAEDADGLAAAGVDPSRIAVVGSVVYASSHRGTPPPRAPAAVAAARAALGVPPARPLVLALTATVTKGLAAMARPAAHRACWRDLAELARRRPDLTFAIKPHPSYDHFELYRRVARAGPANLVFLADAPLAAAVAAADATVLVNYATTAALEGLLAGVPALFLQSGLYPQDADDPLAAGGAVVVRSVAELEAVMDRLLGDPHVRGAALAAGAVAAQRMLGPPGMPALAHVLAELHAMVAAAPEHELKAPQAEREPLATALAAVANAAAAGDRRGAGLLALRLLAGSPGAVRHWPAIRRHLVRLVLSAAAPGRAVLALAGALRGRLARLRAARRRPPDLASPPR
jgi:hypothetical protein